MVGFFDDSSEFNAAFLGILVGCGALSIFSLLYFNRVFASIVSWALRTYTWHQHRVHIDIQALQISLLAGRIFFTGLRYHGNNETILVQNGHITWAYWLRRVREVDIKNGKRKGQDEKTPCRIKVSLRGLEWFIYNRSPAYDSILTGLTESEDGAQEVSHGAGDKGVPPVPPSHLRRRHSKRSETSRRNSSVGQVSAHNNGRSFAEDGSVKGNDGTRPLSASSSGSVIGVGEGEHGRPADAEDLPLLLQTFPIHLECKQAALVMGNENTKAILIVKTELLSGEIDASETDTPDPYRQYFRFNFKHPVIEMKENSDFKEEQAERAAREKQTARESTAPPNRSFLRLQRRRLRDGIRGLMPFWNKSVESFSTSSRDIRTAGSHVPGTGQWQGLSRYLSDNAADQKSKWASAEYAAVPVLLDSPEASLTIFWDVPSIVSPATALAQEKASELPHNINGNVLPPTWAIRLAIKGGSINYGPWADRHRADLQRNFVPSLCKDAVPAADLHPGAYRVPTQFKFYVEIEDTVNIRVPTKEESKNWRWKDKEPDKNKAHSQNGRKARGRPKKSDQPVEVHQRPYGWLDIRVPANSTVSYSMDMTAGESGYGNTLDIDLPTTEISSSINHELLWRSNRQRISCDLGTPLRWNALRQWHFKIASDDLSLFLLRDHIFLLTDLIDDWASGPPADYLVFTPFKYHLSLELQNVQLYLNLNDANIVNNPADLDDNTYLVISSPLLECRTCIPIDSFRPRMNEIPFDIRAETTSVDLHVPPWNTQAAFLTSREVGRLENLIINGGYHYNATTSASNIDTLILNIAGQSPVANLHGFLIRYLLTAKDNYFGDNIHFRTLEEHQEMLRLKEIDPEAELANKPPPKKSNDLDVILSIRVDDPRILLPANLYSSQRHIQIDTASIALDLRFTNYYMDMDLTIAPLNLSLGNTESGTETPISATSSTQMFVDGLNVYGHRLFGLPPTEPTYMCNWDLSVGAVTGECTTEFLATLMSAGKAFAFTFDDEENALVSLSSIVVYDVTFLKVFLHSIRLWIHVEEAAFLLQTGSIDVNYNDWARSHYSKRANISIPDIKISCVNAESATRFKTRPHHPVDTDALVETSVRLSIIGRKANFSKERRLQQELVQFHDQRTHRTPFLVLPGIVDDLVLEQVEPCAQSVPPVPIPTAMDDVGDDRSSLNSRGTSKRSRTLRHKSSFLSMASSAQSSILKPLSSKRESGKGKLLDRVVPTTPNQKFADRSGSSLQGRELSPSTRHSAFYSASGDNSERQDIAHNTVAFSSQYFAPYFPLENVKPSHREAMMQSIERDIEDESGFDSLDLSLDDVDPSLMREDLPHSTVILELPSGLTAFCNPTSLRHVATLLGSLQASDPDFILDNLQMDSVKDILDMQQDQALNGRISDLLVRLPHANLRLINSSEPDALEQPTDEQDQYDVAITKLAFTSRTQTTWKDSFKPQSKEARNSFHLSLNSAVVSAAERFRDVETSQAAAVARVENVMASMGTKDVTYLEIEVGDAQSSTSSEKVEYLASLVQRAGALGSEIGRTFSQVSLREKASTQNLVERLVSSGQKVPDPSFLIRPSAVLRSATQHLRTFDSWKLAMRLRQMWKELALTDAYDVKLDWFWPPPENPAQSRQQVVLAFEKWRSWDLENVSESVLLSLVFGRPPNVWKPDSPSKPVLAVAKINQFQIALNPGPKQNEISLVDLTARAQIKPPLSGRQPEHPNATCFPTILVNVYCGDASISLNWELFELADSLLRLVKRMQSEPPVEPNKHSPTAMPTPRKAPDHVIHCILSLGRGSLILEAINISSESYSNGANVSVLAKRGANDSLDTNMILSCDSVSSSLRSHHQKLVKLVMEKPSVYVSHELQATQTTDSHTIKTTASSKYMNVMVKQDPITLTEVLDLLVQDEFAQLYKLKHQFPTSPPSSTSSSKKIVDRLSAFRVNAALFMDQYTICIPLLRSLTYTVHGTVSRAAMAANFGKEIIFDFDIKENSHDMQIKVNNVARSISLLQIPPTNGRVISHMEPGEHSVNIFVSLELVQLDASAVYSLLSALNRPEVSNAIAELQQQGKTIQEHIKEVVGEASRTMPDAPTEQGGDVLAYGLHLTFAGLEVFGNSPLKSEMAPLAHISFALDSIRLSLSNQIENHGPILTYPEFNVKLRRIAFDIQKGTAEAMKSCGNVGFGALVTASSRPGEDGKDERFFNIASDGFEVNLSPDTVATVVDVLGYMGDKIKDLDTTRELEYLRKLRQSKPRITINDAEEEEGEEADIIDTFLSSFTYTFEIRNIQIAWLVGSPDDEHIHGKDDLVLSLKRIEFATRTGKSAGLTIENLQLQMVSQLQDKKLRSPNSALLPEIILKVAYKSKTASRRLAFQAVGKGLDLRLTSGFIVPAANLNDSIGLSLKNIQKASQNWDPVIAPAHPATPDKSPEAKRKSLFGSKRLESLLVDAEFDGAVVNLTGKKVPDDLVSATRSAWPGTSSRQGQLGHDDTSGSTVLRSPGLAWKIEYRDNGREDPSLHGEVKIDASSNILYPSVVPLVVDISNSIKQVVSSRDDQHKPGVQATTQDLAARVKLPEEDSILTADPTTVLGRMKLNLGLRICKQEFSLSCQPIARVAATASFQDVYFTVNTVRSMDHGNFFAISGNFTNLQASVQHVYSRESTGSFKVQTIVLSLLNSKHVSGTSGVSAILKVSPMEVTVNAKQLQDFMLFREIWLPREIMDPSPTPVAKLATETSQGHLVQRYQQVARTAAFPWTASVAISSLKINVDLGQALGKSTFSIENFWVSSKKTSDWEQNLCLGFKMIGIESTGRMSGFITLQDFKLRTSIEWPEREQALNETPMVQASVGFSQFRVKVAFDYQAFLVADITSLEFLMYNLRRSKDGAGDRLVAIFDGEAVQVFGTTTSAAQAIAMYQAFQRLVQERKANFETSLKEIERYMKRKSVPASAGMIKRLSIKSSPQSEEDDSILKSPISLDTDVIVTLRALNLGIFPSTFSDHQVFKMEALNAQARFAASIIDDGRIHSVLGLTLGQLRIGLAGVRTTAGTGAPTKTLSDLSVEDVVQSATGSRGGTILKVPRVEAVMQTWQHPASKHIDYIFKSAFEGKVEVGWNYSRISYIRGMWANHSKTLAQTWGRELPTNAVTAAIKVSQPSPPTVEEGGSGGEIGKDDHSSSRNDNRNKITAEVNVPQSKYEYNALEPPIIETPQLRDMGEATPPLEWIGLHRDRLPNLTHQIVIVTLLELAGEVEDAYSRILGSS
ncbi:protein CSF1 [Cladorrhinum samala]|uniref:Protein CSF1 n=1 Tax=Cladorrhinum samala TaxID=585594 RepID=A0AAV9H850_9PEZI|nr:protein CSF1 [Cladorrhinum samala]